MASNVAFSEEEMAVDEALGYPKAYAKLCRGGFSRVAGIYIQGPPSVFFPYSLNAHEAARAKELGQLFPIVNPEAEPSVNPNGFANLLWKQLSHLGNSGFDPALFRVDTYGNVLYFYADPASPLYWDIDHWFPCSRGGGTVPSNLRILQWQVCRKKHNKLEFLIPWWDLQLGISVNQFLSIFASKESDFRNRAFSFLFLGGGNEVLGELQTVRSHTFPQQFVDKKRHLGLAPAAIVLSQKQSTPAVLKPLNLNSSRCSSLADDRGLNGTVQMPVKNNSKENDDPDMEANPYMAIAKARDSLRQRDESKKIHIQAEIRTLEDEMSTLRQTTDLERVNLQDLEAQLIKKRRRVEKTRRLAEAQASYKDLLEKMIRDAMHKTVVYKEQLRMNQAATITLKARLEAQRAMCDSSEKELYQKYRLRDEIESRIAVYGSEQARKRSRVDDAVFHDAIGEEDVAETISAARRLKKELRVFLEEEQRAYELEKSLGLHDREEAEVAGNESEAAANNAMVSTSKDGNSDKRNVALEKGSYSRAFALDNSPLVPSPLVTEDNCDDDAYTAQIGKDNVDKWLKLFLENTKEGDSSSLSSNELKGSENHNHREGAATNKLQPINISKPSAQDSIRNGTASITQYERESNRWADARTPRTSSADEDGRSGKTLDHDNENNHSRKKGVPAKPDSPRSFRPFLPPSPSVMLELRKSMDCIRKKPQVADDNDAPGSSSSACRASKLFKSRSRSAKKSALL